MIAALLVRVWRTPVLRHLSVCIIAAIALTAAFQLAVRRHDAGVRDRAYREAIAAESRRHVELLEGVAASAAAELDLARSTLENLQSRYGTRRDAALTDSSASPAAVAALATADTALAAADTALTDCDSLVAAKNAIIFELMRGGRSLYEPAGTWRSRLSVFAEGNYEVMSGISGVRGGVAFDVGNGLSAEAFIVREQAEKRPRFGVGVRKRF